MYKKIILQGVIDYPNLFRAKSFKNDDERFFSCVLLIDKRDTHTLDKYNRVYNELREEQQKQMGKGRLSSFKSILRDGDLEKQDDEAYQNKFFINLKQKQTEQVQHLQVLKKKTANTYIQLNESDNEIYAGCRVAVEVSFFNYNSNGSTGISGILKKVLKIGDAQRIQRQQYEDEDTSCFDSEKVDYEIDEDVPF